MGPIERCMFYITDDSCHCCWSHRVWFKREWKNHVHPRLDHSEWTDSGQTNASSLNIFILDTLLYVDFHDHDFVLVTSLSTPAHKNDISSSLFSPRRVWRKWESTGTPCWNNWRTKGSCSKKQCHRMKAWKKHWNISTWVVLMPWSMPWGSWSQEPGNH